MHCRVAQLHQCVRHAVQQVHFLTTPLFSLHMKLACYFFVVNVLMHQSCMVNMAVSSAGAMTEARARAGPGTAEAERVCSSVTDALSEVLQSYGARSTERCVALEALIWAQVHCYFQNICNFHWVLVQSTQQGG